MVLELLNYYLSSVKTPNTFFLNSNLSRKMLHSALILVKLILATLNDSYYIPA